MISMMVTIISTLVTMIQLLENAIPAGWIAEFSLVESFLKIQGKSEGVRRT